MLESISNISTFLTFLTSRKLFFPEIRAFLTFLLFLAQNSASVQTNSKLNIHFLFGLHSPFWIKKKRGRYASILNGSLTLFRPRSWPFFGFFLIQKGEWGPNKKWIIWATTGIVFSAKSSLSREASHFLSCRCLWSILTAQNWKFAVFRQNSASSASKKV